MSKRNPDPYTRSECCGADLVKRWIDRRGAMTSTLIQIRPDGSEDRTCARCKQPYLLPIPYEKCSPKTRDLCTKCIHDLQVEHEGATT